MIEKKKWIFLFLFTLLLLPLAQHCIPFVNSGRLYGWYTDARDSVFSWDRWFDGRYQSGKNDYCNDHTGFREDLLRVNNQVDFSLFGICHAAKMVAGKDGYLYMDDYIDAYFGKDYAGYHDIHENCVKLKAIQDTLERLGKHMIFMHAASKVTSYPEYLPTRYEHEKRGVTNSTVYKRLMDSLGIRQIDADGWFLSMKRASEAPLFSKQGIHWTVYGTVLAADSLVKYMERVGHIHMPHVTWTEMERTNRLRAGDDDIARNLNLIFPEAEETLGYPVLKEERPDSAKKKPNVVYLGDSFGFKMVVSAKIAWTNAGSEYWSYFDEVHGINPYKFTYIKYYDWQGALNKADYLVIIYTTFNLSRPGNGFIEAAYNYYYPGKK